MAKILTFNGVDQYATMPNYTTLGDPTAYRSITYDTNNRDSYVIDGSSEPISEFGRIGGNYHSGTLANLRITDSSPIQNTDAMVGDGSVYLQVPRMVIGGGFSIEFDWRRQAETSDYTLLTGQDALQSATSSIVIKGTDDIVLTDLNGTTATITDAVVNVVNGQHCHIKLRAVEDYEVDEGESTADVNDFICYVDGQETARVSMTDVSALELDFQRIGTLPTSMIIQNLRVGTELGPQWTFPLNEGTGTNARNSNEVTRNKSYYTNVQTYSYDLSVETGTPPPPPPPPPTTGDRADVIYFSGGETGAIQPSSSREDGWAVQNFTPYAAQAVSMSNDVARAGTRSLRCYYNYTLWGDDANGKRRSEVRKPGNIFLVDGGEYWVGFSTYMHDNANNRALIAVNQPNCSFFQWHFTDTSTSQVHLRGGRYVGNFGTYSSADMGAIVLGEWTDWVYHVKCSTSGDGFIYLWRDAASDSESPIYSRTGSNLKSALSDTSLDFKFGVYRGANEWGNADYAEQFYDEFRIAQGASANFNSVKPG